MAKILEYKGELQLDSVESPEEYKRRRISHYVVYFTMSSSSFFHTALIISLWPYLNKLDSDADKNFLGYIAGIGAMATTILCPLFGKWSNRTQKGRLPFVITLLCGAVSYILYIYLPLFPHETRRYWFLFTRCLHGISEVSIGLARGYIAESTLNTERRGAISILTGCQTIALACGPAVQSILVPIGEQGYWLIEGVAKLDMYTAIGWLGLLMTTINIILFHPRIFEAYDMRHVDKSAGVNVNVNKFYKSLAWLFIVLHFILIWNYVFLKVLGTPIVMDEYAMSRPDALQLNSYIVSGGALVSLGAIFLVDVLCRKFGEMKVMYLGFILIVIGRVLMYPMGDTNVQTALNQTSLGCPQWSQKWCIEEKQMQMWQFILSNMLDNFGYSLSVTIIYTQFSMVFGSKQQGTWMGLMTSLSGLSRVVSPVIFTKVYAGFGNANSVLASNLTFIIFVIVNLGLIFYLRKVGRTSGEVQDTPEEALVGVNDQNEKEMVNK